MKVINVLNVFFSNRLLVNEINCNTSKTERNKVLSRFKNKNETINILCNVHILDEGIDIPECDSVFLTHPNHNPINFIQRISRCNRLKPANSGLENLAHVLIWAKDESKVQAIDKLISEYLKISQVASQNKYVRNSVLPTDIILNTIPAIVNEVTSIPTVNTLIEYIQKETGYSYTFIDEYYAFYKLCENETFGIPAEKVIIYLGITNQYNFKERLRATYTLNTDFVIIRKQQKSTKGVKDAHYMISFETFEKICMNSSTEKGQMFRDYFVMLRKFNVNGIKCIMTHLEAL